jgi:hypothetical protein
MRKRIHNLEQLIRSLMDKAPTNQSTSDTVQPQFNDDPLPLTPPTMDSQLAEGSHENGQPTREEISDSVGHMQIGDAETVYVSPSHWTAILDNVCRQILFRK